MKAQVGAKKDRPLAALVVRAESAMSELRGRAIGRRRSPVEETKLVRDAMSDRVASIDPEEPVARAAERLAEQNVGVLAVCRAGDRLSGVITDRDIVVRAIAQGLDPDGLSAGECGTGEPVTVSPWETLDQAAQRMDEQQVRRLPVTEAGRLVGILSQSDLAAHGAHQRAGRLLERMAGLGGDRRSARWLQRRPYRGREESRSPKGGA
jgi:CBS domain-containing protein